MSSPTPDPGVAGFVREQIDALRRDLVDQQIEPLAAELEELKHVVVRARLARLEDAAFRVIHTHHHLLPAPPGLGLNFDACMNAVVAVCAAARQRVEDAADQDEAIDETLRAVSEPAMPASRCYTWLGPNPPPTILSGENRKSRGRPVKNGFDGAVALEIRGKSGDFTG